MPIALAIASKAMGVTTQELMKMMEQGQLMANEFLPKFSKELRSAAREGDALAEGLKTSRIAMQRAGVAFNLNVLDAFDVGVESGLSDMFNLIAGSLEDSAPFFRIVGRLVGFLAKTFGVLLKVVSTLFRPLTMLWDAVFQDTENNMAKTKDGIDGISSSLEVLVRVFKFLAAVVLTPFALLEAALDKAQGFIDNFLGKNSNKLGIEVAANQAMSSAGRSSSGKGNNQVTIGDTKFEIYSNDPEETGRIVQTKMDERFDMIFTSSMAGG
jgi:hypothetical protein